MEVHSKRPSGYKTVEVWRQQAASSLTFLGKTFQDLFHPLWAVNVCGLPERFNWTLANGDEATCLFKSCLLNFLCTWTVFNFLPVAFLNEASFSPTVIIILIYHEKKKTQRIELSAATVCWHFFCYRWLIYLSKCWNTDNLLSYNTNCAAPPLLHELFFFLTTIVKRCRINVCLGFGFSSLKSQSNKKERKERQKEEKSIFRAFVYLNCSRNLLPDDLQESTLR